MVERYLPAVHYDVGVGLLRDYLDRAAEELGLHHQKAARAVAEGA